MIYRVQKGFEDFKCIAGDCPKSCCIGWQIMIDDESLESYKEVTGEFAQKLHDAIDFDEGCFRQDKTRCKMLNENGLCDLHSNLGEESLCMTCHLYPRHIEEFPDLREMSLTLSCPEVARLVLSTDYTFDFNEAEDDTDDEEEYEDFDLLLFDMLEYAREKMLALSKDSSVPFMEKLRLMASYAYRLQTLYDEGKVLKMQEISIEETSTTQLSSLVSSESYAPQSDASGIDGNFDYCLKFLDFLSELEVLEDSWTAFVTESLTALKSNLTSRKEWESDSTLTTTVLHRFENILNSLMFTYFCGAVYDGQIYARAMIAIQSVRALIMLSDKKTSSLTSTLYLYSREIEHSDPNINALISFFESELS
ncbi:MAG: flagellin lysine-N-methylase [Lachnospiraceae bacterium]|nr:flagellin lysine-N-methylase [Lachnospiraceae bacterium]